MQESSAQEADMAAGPFDEKSPASIGSPSRLAAPGPLRLETAPFSGDGAAPNAFADSEVIVESPGSERSFPMSLEFPIAPTPLEIALSAFQYLPVPILVLGPLKTVVLSNEAMGRLCCETSKLPLEQGSRRHVYVAQSLKGQTLSQIGVDMIQKDGNPVWVNWEEFLDTIGEDEPATTDQGVNQDQQDEQSSLKPTDQAADSTTAGKDTAKTTVHDICLDVVLTPLRCNFRASISGSDSIANSVVQIHAQMIVSTWTLDEAKYVTLTFTSSATNSGHSQTPVSSSRSVPKPARPTSSPHAYSNASSHSTRRSQTESTTSSNVSSPSSSTFLTNGPPSRINLSSSASILQKTTRLRDGLLGSMHLPCYAVWHDYSVGIPNKALLKLLPERKDNSIVTQEDFIKQFICWKEDFSRKLDFDEYPITVLCRTQKPFQNVRIGLTHPKTGQPMVYDCNGECVLDDNGEFQGGICILKDVTEYVDKLQQQKEKTAQQFEMIANMVPQMVWTTTPSGWHDWFSHRWYEYTGLTEEDSIGYGWRLPFHPDDMGATVPRWEHSLRTGEEYVTEYRCRRKDGQWRWMLGRALPLRNENGEIVRWFGTCTDIHEAVEAREAARRNKAQLLQILETAQITLWAVDMRRNLIVLEGSQMWHSDQTRGLHSDLVGRNLYELFNDDEHAESSRQYQEPIEMILSRKSQEEFRESQVEGSDRWYRTRYLPVHKPTYNTDGEGNSMVLDGAVAISVDITELRARDLELRNQEKENSKLVANAMAAKAASEMKSQFLYTVSHEVRSPIAGVIGMSELLLDTNLDQEQKDCVENIQRSANGLLTVINDILDFSKVESGRLDIEEVQFRLSVVIKDVHKMLSFAAERKNLTYESAIQSAIARDLRVMGDPGRLRQILQNLLTNSIKFTDEGRVLLSAKVKGETPDSLKIEFVVEDTGIGIEEEVQKNLFKPFSQADSSTARRYGGTGLGLSISKSLVELMNGEIKLESRLGFGTTVTFWIPFKKAEYRADAAPLVELNPVSERFRSDLSISAVSGGSSDRITPPVTPMTANQSSEGNSVAAGSSSMTHRASTKQTEDLSEAERKKTHVLVVEDNPINQQIAIKTIEKLNFSVSACWNGQEAIDYLMDVHLGKKRAPDVILMDVQMPLVDGYQATEMIRLGKDFPELRRVPIVAMTASAIQGDKEKCQQAGMDDYLAKPVRRKILETMILKWAIKAKKRRSVVSTRDTAAARNTIPDIKMGKDLQPTGRLFESSKPHPSAAEVQMQRSRFERDAAIAKSVATEDTSLMNRVEAEEKAISLRDEKLIDMAYDPRGPGHPPAGEERLSGPPLALTEANMDKFVDQQEQLDAKLLHLGTHPAPSRSNLSMTVQGRPSMDSIRTGEEEVRMKNVPRPSLLSGRNGSDNTIKKGDPTTK